MAPNFIRRHCGIIHVHINFLSPSAFLCSKMSEGYAKFCRPLAYKILVLLCLFLLLGAANAARAQTLGKFSISNRVQTTANLNVRSSPSLSGAIVGTESSGVQGTVTRSSTAADGYNWWYVVYDDGVSGWSVENYLTKVSTAAPSSSTKFTIGNRVRVATTTLDAREIPSVSSTVSGTEFLGAQGTVVSGPIAADGYDWWQVKYDDGTLGWSKENFLVQVQASLSSSTTPYAPLAIGDRVQTMTNLNVRASSSLSGAIKEVELPGVKGVIVGGPASADGYKWWHVKYDDGVDGWSVETYLAKVTASTTGKFTLGERVQTTANVNVRATPSISGVIDGTEALGAQGAIVGGPAAADGYYWWQVSYDDGNYGWSVENYLTQAPALQQASSSAKFTIGDKVQTTAGTNVRNLPSLTGTKILGTQPAGATGVVQGGPFNSSSTFWWNINYDSGANGWSIEDNLAKVTSVSSVKITSPKDGATVSGDITVSATVNDGYAITKVDFSVAGMVYTTVVSPYKVSVSTLNFTDSNTPVYISATAYDVAGGVYTSPTISVKVSNAAKFSRGERIVTTTSTTNVYAAPTPASPSMMGNLLGTQPLGTLGVVSSGPIYAYSYGWWLVNYDTGPDGWTVQDSFSKYVPPPDTVPPTISITSPTSSQTLSGVVTVSADASDNIGVAKVYFYIDGIYKSAVFLSSPPFLPTVYSFDWDSSNAVNASHTVAAMAYDGAGNIGTSAAVTIRTSNVDSIPPVVRINSPENGKTVNGVVGVSVSATDNVAVASISLLVDGTPIGPAATSSYRTFIWDTNLTTNANHTLVATATDASGNVGTSATVTVGVNNPPPSTKFSIGDRVIATSSVYVRPIPSPYFLYPLGTQFMGSMGTVIGGPEYSDKFYWWKVSFDSGFTGWVAESYVEKLSANLLLDPGFEAGGSAWQGSAASGRSVTTSGFHSGTQSEEIDVSSVGLQPVYQDVTSIIPGASYEATGWVKANGAGGSGARIYLLWFSGSPAGYVFPQSVGSIVSQVSNCKLTGNLVRVDYLGGIFGSGGWTNFLRSFTAPYTANAARFLIVADKDPDNIGSSWFDDLGLFRYGSLPTADATPPMVSISSPANKFSVPGGTVGISVSASDNVAVLKVDITVDGTLAVSCTVSPYFYTWDASVVAEGAHAIKATATDEASNVSSTAVTVYVDRTPPTAPTGLQAAASAPTRVGLTWSPSSDNIGVSGYKITRNGALVATSPTASYADASAVPASYYTYAVSAFDAAGNTSPSSAIVSVVTPSPAPSTRFVVGQNVRAISDFTVRATPSLSGNILGTRSPVPDTTPPSVVMTSPSDGSTLTKTIRFAADAVDMGVTQGTVVAGPVYANGYWWWDVDFDFHFLDTVPTFFTLLWMLEHTAPPSGWVQESCLADAGVTKVEFYIEGVTLVFASSSPYTATINVPAISGGPFELYAKAYDVVGNVGTSPSIHVSISNPPPDITPPTASITSPADGATISGIVNVTANASDNVGVTKVDFYVDGLPISSKTSAPYNFSWDTTQEDNGPHFIYLMAHDAAGNIGMSDYVTVTVQN
jgi:uncharacterized protein YgiM (DUF1202 family)